MGTKPVELGNRRRNSVRVLLQTRWTDQADCAPQFVWWGQRYTATLELRNFGWLGLRDL